MARLREQVGDLLADRVAVGVLIRAFPPELVDRVVDRLGVREQRMRALPARLMVYYVLTMVMFFRSGYGEVWDKLVSGLAWAYPFTAEPPREMRPTPAAITYARKRLGSQVMAALVEEAAGPQVREEPGHVRVGGMRLVALDEAPLSLPNTPGNVSVFGYPPGGSEPDPVPQARVVALGECGTSAILGAGVFGAAFDETALIRELLRKLDPGDLLLFGGILPAYDLLGEVIAAGAHVLWQAGPEDDLPRLSTLPDGTYLSRLAGPAARPGSGGAPGLAVRVIPDAGEGPPAAGRPGKPLLVTDILDARVLPAEACVAAHASRWRLGDCFSTLDLLPPGGSAVTLRSRDPDLIRQEVHAILCCYQAVRLLVSRRPNGQTVPAAISHQPAEARRSARALPAWAPGAVVGLARDVRRRRLSGRAGPPET
ncbi:transposase domain-containing protein [Actinoallomurus soli]|uniref:transposase domain-containing protein n=1 Tax=Actinoallomurus soli TaxID=2952535 RepID=UPI002091FAC5|nr:transposase domain-containing protein [Actinoallomurus soli]MCO5972493.1 transposase domain-containing protein [Actinoallomurus soli]